MRWDGKTLFKEGVAMATLIPAQVAGLTRWRVIYGGVTSQPCTLDTARRLAESIGRIGMAPTKKMAAS
jgi:hypothetical protein